MPPGGDEAGGAVCAATNRRGKGSSEANLRIKLQRGNMLHRKRILFAINSLAGGGAERVLATLLGGSEPWRARYDIHLALLDDEPRAYDVPDWVELHQLDARPRLLPSLAHVRALTRRPQPHATLSFLPPPHTPHPPP